MTEFGEGGAGFRSGLPNMRARLPSPTGGRGGEGSGDRPNIVVNHGLHAPSEFLGMGGSAVNKAKDVLLKLPATSVVDPDVVDAINKLGRLKTVKERDLMGVYWKLAECYLDGSGRADAVTASDAVGDVLAALGNKASQGQLDGYPEKGEMFPTDPEKQRRLIMEGVARIEDSKLPLVQINGLGSEKATAVAGNRKLARTIDGIIAEFSPDAEVVREARLRIKVAHCAGIHEAMIGAGDPGRIAEHAFDNPESASLIPTPAELKQLMAGQVGNLEVGKALNVLGRVSLASGSCGNGEIVRATKELAGKTADPEGSIKVAYNLAHALFETAVWDRRPDTRDPVAKAINAQIVGKADRVEMASTYPRLPRYFIEHGIGVGTSLLRRARLSGSVNITNQSGLPAATTDRMLVNGRPEAHPQQLLVLSWKSRVPVERARSRGLDQDGKPIDMDYSSLDVNALRPDELLTYVTEVVPAMLRTVERAFRKGGTAWSVDTLRSELPGIFRDTATVTNRDDVMELGNCLVQTALISIAGHQRPVEIQLLPLVGDLRRFIPPEKLKRIAELARVNLPGVS